MIVLLPVDLLIQFGKIYLVNTEIPNHVCRQLCNSVNDVIGGLFVSFFQVH
jgi:hypothetical protein